MLKNWIVTVPEVQLNQHQPLTSSLDDISNKNTDIYLYCLYHYLPDFLLLADKQILTDTFPILWQRTQSFSILFDSWHCTDNLFPIYTRISCSWFSFWFYLVKFSATLKLKKLLLSYSGILLPLWKLKNNSMGSKYMKNILYLISHQIHVNKTTELLFHIH